MCGHYALHVDPASVARHFALDAVPAFAPLPRAGERLLRSAAWLHGEEGLLRAVAAGALRSERQPGLLD